MITLTVGLAGGVILVGIAAGLTITSIVSIFVFGSVMGWSVFAFADNVATNHTAKSCGIAALIILQIVAIVAMAILADAILPVIGIVAAGAMALFTTLIIVEAIFRSSSKIEIPDHELGTEKTLDYNESSEVSDHNPKEGNSISTEKNPNAEVNQINLEKGIVREEEGRGNGGIAVQSIAV